MALSRVTTWSDNQVLTATALNAEFDNIINATPTGTIVGTSDSQTLTNKTLTSPTLTTPTIASFVNATHTHQAAASGGTIAEAALALTDVTTADVTTSVHGFTPKAPNDTTKFLRGDATWAVPSTTATGSLIDSDFAVGSGGDDTATDSNFVDISGLTVTLALGSNTCTVLVWATQQVHTSQVDTQAMLRCSIGGTAGNNAFVFPGNNATGVGSNIVAFQRLASQTGNVICKAQFGRQSGTGTITAYNQHGHIMAMAFKE